VLEIVSMIKSLKWFLTGILINLKKIKNGYKLKDKINLVLLVPLISVSGIDPNVAFEITEAIIRLVNLLLRNIIVSLDSVCYAFVDLESYRIMVFENFETFMWRYLTIKNKDVFVDIGAHIGKYTLHASKEVGEQGRVVSIEPHPLNYGVLERNISINNLKNVISLNVAASHEEMKINLYLHHTSAGHSLKPEMKPTTHWKTQNLIVVSAEPVDQILSRLQLNADWIKIDVEGGEIDVIRGATETIRKDRPRIMVEVWRPNISLLHQYMDALGYSVQLIPETRDWIAPYFFCYPIQP